MVEEMRVEVARVESRPTRSTASGRDVRRWTWVVVIAVGLALVSLAPKLSGDPQSSGDADALLTVQFTLRKLANAGAVWAGLGIASGWLVRRRLQAAAAGVLSGVIALTVHYALGQSLGMFDSSVWATKLYWFIAALIFGAPLGLVGALARRTGGWGLAARLVIPAGSTLEPFARRMFTTPSTMTMSQQVSSVLAGAILLVGGLLCGTAIVAAGRKGQRHPRRHLIRGSQGGSAER